MRALLFGFLALAACSKKTESGITGYVDISPRYNGGMGAGKLTVAEAGNDVRITGKLTELKAGNYVVHLHLPKGCPPPTEGDDPENHKSQLGIVTADASGAVQIDMTIAGARLGGTDPIDGYCIVIQPPDSSGYLASGKILTPGYGLGPK
jgi:hypothetical protein